MEGVNPDLTATVYEAVCPRPRFEPASTVSAPQKRLGVSASFKKGSLEPSKPQAEEASQAPPKPVLGRRTSLKDVAARLHLLEPVEE